MHAVCGLILGSSTKFGMTKADKNAPKKTLAKIASVKNMGRRFMRYPSIAAIPALEIGGPPFNNTTERVFGSDQTHGTANPRFPPKSRRNGVFGEAPKTAGEAPALPEAKRALPKSILRL
jgi:hypothetical protein